MKELIFFSHNKYKIKEVKQILKIPKIKILTLDDFPKINEPRETGKTFEENAMIKSTFGFIIFWIALFCR